MAHAVSTTLNQYSIVVPTTISTKVSKTFKLHVGETFNMWLTANGGHDNPLFGSAFPDEPFTDVDVTVLYPAPLSQRSLSTANRWKRESALARPESLSTASLGENGYNFELPETDATNLRCIERAIMSDKAGYERYLVERNELALNLVNLIYPGPDFSAWYLQFSEDEPMTAEFLLELANAQIEAFLSRSPGLFNTAPATDSIGDPSLTLDTILLGSKP